MVIFYPRLDGLRAFAVFAVMVYHWNAPVLLGRALPLGFVGVQLFFVLSGYLIGGILLRAQHKNETDGTSQLLTLRQFVLRRGLRIFPAYFAFLLLTGILLGTPDPDWWWYPLYLGNFQIEATSRWPDYWAHTWTLAVEEQFYLFAPVVALFLRRRLFVMALSGLLVVSGSLAMLTSTSSTLLPPRVFYGLLVGVALSVVVEQSSARPRMLGVVGAVSTAASLTAFTFDLMEGRLLGLFGPVSFAALVWWATGSSRAGQFLEWKPLMYVGSLAYGLYLWHMPVPVIWNRLDLPTAENSWVMLGPYSLMTFVIAKASWVAIEKPLNSLKTRLPYHPLPATHAGNREDAPAMSSAP